METKTKVLKGISTISVLLYGVLVVGGLLKNELFTYQWVALLIATFLWILIRTVSVPRGVKENGNK